MTDTTEFHIRPATNADGEPVRAIVFDTLREFCMTPDQHGTDADLADIESFYPRRGGRFSVVVDAGGEVIGCVGLARVNATTVELRKMYLRRDARGRGLGRRLLDHAVAEARGLGFRQITLETASCLTDAIAMYRRYGFVHSEEPVCVARCDQVYVLDLDRRKG